MFHQMTSRSVLTKAAALALMALAGGCSSDGDRLTQVDERSDLSDHNRMLVRMTMAENVYNGNAVSRAVYPRDFDDTRPSLNELGKQRVEQLVNVLRAGQGRVVVVRGDASDDLYAERIAAVRQQLADSGISSKEVMVAPDTYPVGGSSSSDRALLTYNSMMAGYAPQQRSNTTGDMQIQSGRSGSGGGGSSSGNSSK